MARRFLWVALVVAGCSGSHGLSDDAGAEGGVDAATADRSLPPPDRDSGSSVDAGAEEDASSPDDASPPDDAGVPEPPAGTTVCGGSVCEEGEECCVLMLECFDPAEPGACEPPDGGTAPDGCASNADCEDDELCTTEDDRTCGGTTGRCEEMRGEELCGGFGDGVCGCDGRTYADPCAASRAGVGVRWDFPCGSSPFDPGTMPCDEAHPTCDDGWSCDFERERCVQDDPFIACGIDAQCPEGSFCCAVVGACMPSDCPECCFVPPEGTEFPCVSDDDCAVLVDDLGGTVPSDWYCEGASGCGSPGGCKRRDDGCGGELEPVCGCDGTSYANPCWASMAGVTIAHPGEC